MIDKFANIQQQKNQNGRKKGQSDKLFSLLKKMNSTSLYHLENNYNDLIPFPLEFKYTGTLNSTKVNNNNDKNNKIQPQINSKEQNKFLHLYSGISSIGGGLNNLGNTCFLNSVLQSVIFTLPMNNFFLKENHTEKCKVKPICLLCAMCRLTKELQQRKTITPIEIAKNIKMICKHIRIGRQEDAHEFLVYLLDALEQNYNKYLKSLNSKFIIDEGKIANNNSRNVNLIHNIFGGELTSEVKCFKCKKKSITNEKFVSVSLEILNSDNLEKCIENFCKAEPLVGKNKYYCENCKEKNDSTKRFLFKSLPNVLILHLKRFDNKGRKIQSEIKYPNEIDMQRYLINYNDNNYQSTRYKLYSVLIHNGTFSDSGHYYTFLKRERTWFEMNDSYVDRVGENYAMNQLPYMFFYIKENISTIPTTTRSLSIDGIVIKSKGKKNEEEEKKNTTTKEIKNKVKDEEKEEEEVYFVREYIDTNRAKVPFVFKGCIEKFKQKIKGKKMQRKSNEKEREKEKEKEESDNESSSDNGEGDSNFLQLKAQFNKNKFKLENNSGSEEDEEKKLTKREKKKKYSNILSNKKEFNNLYHSKKISTWDDSEEEDEKNNELVNNQLQFIQKSSSLFLNKKIKRKSEYDIKLDKGKEKKVKEKTKDKIRNLNVFQKHSDIHLNKKFKYNS